MTDDEHSVFSYFQEVDAVLEKLSNTIESEIGSLPSALLTTRIIELAYWQDEIAVRVTPDSSLDGDTVTSSIHDKFCEFCQFYGPYWMFKQKIRASGDNRFFFSGEFLIDNPSDYMDSLV